MALQWQGRCSDPWEVALVPATATQATGPPARAYAPHTLLIETTGVRVSSELHWF